MCFKCVLILVFFVPPPKKKNDHGSVAPSGDRDRRHCSEAETAVLSSGEYNEFLLGQISRGKMVVQVFSADLNLSG